MRESQKKILGGLVSVGGALVLPLPGAWAVGRDLTGLWDFPPPLNIPALYPRFSWIAAGFVLLLLVALLVPWFDRKRSSRSRPSGSMGAAGISAKEQFPLFGIVALAWTMIWWVLSWTRFAWFSWGQRYTFFPLWLGFIFIVDALASFRGGPSPRRPSTRRWLTLFAVSAAFWWLFE